MSSFGSLSIGISGLLANRRALETVSHNIANADNPTYTRQRVTSADSPYINVGSQKRGTGVSVQSINQIRDEFLDTKLRNEVSKYGYWGQRYSIFSQVESIINEKGQINDKVTGGLAKTMDDFWKSWDELAKDPSNLTVRGVLKESSEGFVTVVRHMYDQLDTLQKNLNTEVIDLVDETNKIAREIADLNKKIVSGEASGVKANDYRDQRNGLIDRLSQIVDISVSEDSKGYVNVAIAGTHIVLEGSAKELEYKTPMPPDKGHLVNVHWKDEKDPLVLGKDLKGGELLAVLQARGSGEGKKPNPNSGEFIEVIPTMKEKLNELVRIIATAINEQQTNGYTLDSVEGDPKTDKLFFISEDGGDIDASNIRLNIESLNDIAASDQAGVKGNSKNAEAILKIRKQLLYNSGKLNIDDYYRDVISDFGIGGEAAYNMMESHGRIIIELDNKKQSISAVSLDEEMSDMLKFQHAYSANTRFINAIDEMLDVIINRMGR
ncbi:flagellar hook-associated protein 1 [Gottschalkia acidurici 9a]|uniref:Flagellar hook-associated protein 1 n=1 Tax=Gottschalkia acidurici (strain ATCC 7906 / DSM 604 / BCRC 14475 / CIP 104303 / KCTC 5404 / NCIMB 10678 / 9a) TaxID=1128398 RepID=K0AY61_GOTA9|nr:flagellar hook-associated protein FlgK [Gottschalkia acidurici]AFS77321.1 flagellar hook-associated protein 1 [Gottschalkia acidurici 9a]